jgi:hypothetical protein
MPTRTFDITPEEREKFLDENDYAENMPQAFVWLAFQRAVNGKVSVYVDEIPLAAEMARRAGLPRLAARLV